jgi:hypothetical protein
MLQTLNSGVGCCKTTAPAWQTTTQAIELAVNHGGAGPISTCVWRFNCHCVYFPTLCTAFSMGAKPAPLSVGRGEGQRGASTRGRPYGRACALVYRGVRKEQDGRT